MSERLTLSFPYSSAEHAAALSDARSHRLANFWIRLCAVAMAVVAIAVTVLGVTVNETPLAEMLGQTSPLLAIAGVWFMVPSALQRARRWFLRRRSSTDQIELRVFSSEGFQGAADWPQPVPWSLVERVVETPNYFLVYAAPDGPSYVPKSAMETADVERLRALLERAIVSYRTPPRISAT